MLSLIRCSCRHHHPDAVPWASRRPSVLFQLLGHVADRRFREGVYLQVWLCVHSLDQTPKEEFKKISFFSRTPTIRLMTWALESSPPATVTQRDTWSGRPQRISRPHTASKVRRQDCVSTSHAGWLLFSLLLLSSLWYSRCWHLDWERAGRVSEDSWAPAGQSGPRRYRDQWSGKREKIGAECLDAFRYPVGFSFQFVFFSNLPFFPIYLFFQSTFKERTISWNKKYETCHRSRIEKWNLIHETFKTKWFAHRITLQPCRASWGDKAPIPVVLQRMHCLHTKTCKYGASGNNTFKQL